MFTKIRNNVVVGLIFVVFCALITFLDFYGDCPLTLDTRFQYEISWTDEGNKHHKRYVNEYEIIENPATENRIIFLYDDYRIVLPCSMVTIREVY